MTIPTPPPAQVIRETKFMAWFAKAAPSEKIEYHRGHLVVDRVNGFSRLDEKSRHELCMIADRAASLADEGRLVLAQRRVGDGLFIYFAIKTKQPA